MSWKENLNCLEVTQLDNLQKNKSILKTKQRFKRERDIVFAEETNKITLSSNDDKRIKLFDSIETYAYWMSKNQVSKKEEIKYNNIIKQYKKWLTLMILQKKT